MGQQTEFVLRNDGFYWAPPIDPSDEVDYPVKFANLLGPDDTIDPAVAAVVSVNYATHYLTDQDDQTITVWLKNAIIKKTVLVSVKIKTVGGRTYERSFKISCEQL